MKKNEEFIYEEEKKKLMDKKEFLSDVDNNITLTNIACILGIIGPVLIIMFLCPALPSLAASILGLGSLVGGFALIVSSTDLGVELSSVYNRVNRPDVNKELYELETLNKEYKKEANNIKAQKDLVDSNIKTAKIINDSSLTNEEKIITILDKNIKLIEEIKSGKSKENMHYLINDIDAINNIKNETISLINDNSLTDKEKLIKLYEKDIELTKNLIKKTTNKKDKEKMMQELSIMELEYYDLIQNKEKKLVRTK
jgi:hypothetical protein